MGLSAFSPTLPNFGRNIITVLSVGWRHSSTFVGTTLRAAIADQVNYPRVPNSHLPTLDGKVATQIHCYRQQLFYRFVRFETGYIRLEIS